MFRSTPVEKTVGNNKSDKRDRMHTTRNLKENKTG